MPPASPARHALIELDAVDVAIAGTTVLRAIDWRLERDERWGVIGANGSGKSTFLQLLAGGAWPVPGRGTRRYDFGSGPERDAVAAKQRIALVGHELQDRYVRFGWNFSAEDVVLSGIYRTDVPRKRPRAAERARAQALLARLGIGPLAERPFLTLSRGEQRRVLIARAVAFRPAVLLLDEPASGLDRRSRAALDRLLEAVIDPAVADGGAPPAIVCTGHATRDLPQVVSQYIELAGGRIVARGTLERHRDDGGPREPPGAHHAAEQQAPAAAATRGASAASGLPLIEVERADVWLGHRRVLHAIDWRLEEGRHWLVTGANGAGKSTFLRMLHGQLRPARGGRVSWPALGNPRNVWALRKAVAWLSPELQADYRFPSTVRECIGSGFESSIGLTRPLTAAERARVDELLELFDLRELAERRTSALSYGQFRRALIARALANGPRVLLLDEPWEGLDPTSAALLDEELERVAANGTALVCSSHLARHLHHFTDELELTAGEVAAVRALR